MEYVAQIFKTRDAILRIELLLSNCRVNFYLIYADDVSVQQNLNRKECISFIYNARTSRNFSNIGTKSGQNQRLSLENKR